MLQQILQDMYIDPDLLAELSEEQKQILFCKMREEQVRRYNEYEEKVDTEKRKPPRPRKPGRRVERIQFLEGKDGNEWVWVMGEHKNDKPIEQIIEEEAQLKAAKLAEVEAEELRNQEETEIAKKAAQEQARLEREKQAQEEELRRQEEEARLYQTLKEAKMAEQKLQEERRKREEEEKRKLKEIEQTQVLRRRKTRESVKQLKERRSSDIYMSFKKARQNFEKTAQETMTKVEVEWKEREKKAKEFDEEKRAIARRAREEHRKSLSMKHSGKVIGAVTAMMRRHTVVGAPPPMTSSNNNSPGSKPRPPRPDDRDAVIDWFKDVEKQKNVGKDPKTRNVEPWFHGVITRVEAESLLENKRVGTYLVRVSEKVWGYTISFKDEDRCKHFLIDTSDDSYQFFGTNQIAHKSLLDLVGYHQKKPISGVGQEVLLFPCGQMRDPPDYYELFQNDKVEVTAL
ncbi:unnamed protein product [Owenia fusiformis]|uniref:Uncharacterized protein n=1 Tax=Owenia fusiformis TaxID=6347 RepID=A0A8J1U536_OWEFU|nr:unnamed protein product [Owenia fusiformis]